VLIIAVVALMVARYVAAQMRLARIKDDLVSTVSHELKTPLAAMRALLDTALAGRYRDAAQMRRYLQLAAKENLRLSHLIENFLVFSRLARGQQQFRFDVLAPEEIVRTALDALGDKLTSPPCRVTTQLAPDLPAIRGDADALSTVLVNLLDNAYKYTNGEKQIAVSVFAEQEQVVLAVADNGIGIAPDKQGRIFDRFYQVDQSLTRQRGGCGLGLSIVQSIVRAHGGVVEVTSEPGKGSTFRVRIPVATLNA
jgi:signal transduction histidine kinase